ALPLKQPRQVLAFFPYTTLFRSKSGSRRSRVSRAARYFPRPSSRLTTVFPAMCPHRLGKRWSSRWIPATPVLTNSCTVRIVDSRSEEHTSELQSRSDLVCRLLVE